MTDAQFIFFNVLNKQDMINVVAFMEENKKATLTDAIDWLYDFIIDGEDEIYEREHDVSYASYVSHLRQCRIDTDWDNIDEILF